MPGKKSFRFTLRDYVSLVLALSLAFVVWLIHNLSHMYSDVVQCNIVALSDIDGHARVSDKAVKLAARCEMEGFSIIYHKMFPNEIVNVKLSKNELIHLGGVSYCIPTANLMSHSHEIFGDNAKCEYFVTDTLFFDFQAVDFKKVPVTLVRKIDYQDQYMATGPVALSPDSVIVYGPSEKIGNIEHVNTRPLVLSDLDSDSAGELQLEVLEGLRYSTSVVNYHLSVCRYVEEIFTVPVLAGGVPEGTEMFISPSSAQLTLRCVFPHEEIRRDVIQIVVDYSDFENSISGQCIARVLNLPDDVLSWHISPEVFDCVENYVNSDAFQDNF